MFKKKYRFLNNNNFLNKFKNLLILQLLHIYIYMCTSVNLLLFILLSILLTLINCIEYSIEIMK